MAPSCNCNKVLENVTQDELDGKRLALSTTELYTWRKQAVLAKPARLVVACSASGGHLSEIEVDKQQLRTSRSTIYCVVYSASG
ncbi:hypothetical protein PoB_003061400 [Plakobranchus ocellatus]|uniref:Uncharacterized protein n=1 Tax=Plakobranchus ocellatus TaxID=259542 RepID=A0AAV4AD19_9GAST|nr:hypothetical protein PoB_003061400 [Plakobranchus ocellatus]